MPGEKTVIFKGRRGGLTIFLDENVEFEDIKKVLKIKLESEQSFFNNANTVISFMGRELSPYKEWELMEIIKDAGLIATLAKPSKPKEKPKTAVASAAQEFPVPEEPVVFDEDSCEIMTKYHKGSLRNGQSIKFAGSIVILGDVNPGAEVIAEGNVIILGALKGLAHAGSAGDMNRFVAAAMLRPTQQLRIADKIIYIPEEKEKKKEKPDAVYACIKDGRICIFNML